MASKAAEGGSGTEEVVVGLEGLQVDFFSSFEMEMLDLLSSPASPPIKVETAASPPKKPAPAKPRRVTSSKQLLYVERHRKKRQAEFIGLQKSVVELEAKLTEMKQKQSLQSLLHPTSKWRQHATNERKRRAKAMLENKSLRDAVEQQMQFTDSLVRAVQAVPQLPKATMSGLPQDQWQYLHLVTDPVLRKAAYHNICDRELGQLQSAFLQAGLLESPVPDVHKHEYKHINHAVQVQTILTGRFGQPVASVTESVWACLTGTALSDDPLIKKLYNDHIPLDPCVCYITGSRDHAQGQFDRRLLCKRYDQGDKCVIVCRSILHDDAIMPSEHNILDEVSWVSIEPEAQDKTVVKYFHKANQARNAGIHLTKSWLERFTQESDEIGIAIRNEAFISSMFDVTSADFSVEWSHEEQNILNVLFTGQRPPPTPTPSEPTSTASSPSSDSRKKQNLALQRHRKKRQAEHEELKRAAVELEATLQHLQQAKALQDILNPPSKWHKLAAEELRLEQKARLENKHLKEMIKEHMEIAQTFTNLIEKKPEQPSIVAGAVSEKWKQFVLVQDPTMRKAAIHNICDRQYDLIDSAFIEAGLIDATTEMQRHVSKFTHGVFELHTIVCRLAPIPLMSVAEASWQVMRGSVSIKNLDQEANRLEDIDANTSYLTGWRHHPMGKYQRRVLCKRYYDTDARDATRCVMVCRSLEQDELFPYEAASEVTNEVSWIELESAPCGGTRAKYFHRIRPSSWKIDSPPSEYWADTLAKHSKMVGNAIHDYIEHFDYSVQWSSQETEILDSLLHSEVESPPASVDEYPSTMPPAKIKHNLALKRYRKKKRDELAQLKEAAAQLEARLQTLQAAKAATDSLHPPTKWQTLAVNERQMEKAAWAENEHLRKLVKEHMITAQVFAHVLEKTWEQTQSAAFLDAPDDKWKQLVLVGVPDLRIRAMHAILDREHANCDDAFIEARLIDVSEEFQKHIAKFHHHSAHEFHTIVHRRTQLQLRCVVEGTWNVIRGTAGGIPNMNRSCKEIIDVDADTSYVTGWFDHPLGKFQRRVLCKRYFNAAEPKDATKCIIVCRSIEDDELAPYESTTPYSNEVSWHLLERNESGGTDFKYFQKFRPSKWTTTLTAHWEKTLEQASNIMRCAVNQYIDQYQMEAEEIIMNANEAFVLGTLDPSSFDYSVQWSRDESEILSTLLLEDESPARLKHNLALQQYRKKKRDEMTTLRKAAAELEDQLRRLQEAKALKDRLRPPSKWQTLAVNERQMEKVARAENAQLKELVHKHMMTAQIFANVLEKTYEQTESIAFLDAPDDKWKQLVLVAAPDLRIRAMHAILDREHARFHSAYIEAGLIDVSEEFQKHIAKFHHHSAHEFHTIVHRRTRLQLRSVVEGTWNVIRGTAGGIPNMNRSCKEIIDVDADTSYVTGWFDHPLGKFQRRVLCKRYFNAAEPKDATKCIIVCRSIEDDELSPYDGSTPYSNEVSWHLLEGEEDEGADFKYFQKFRPSKWTTTLSAHWEKTLEQASHVMRSAVNRYIDEYGQMQDGLKLEPLMKSVSPFTDLLNIEPSNGLEWSVEESLLLNNLVAPDTLKSPSSDTPVKNRRANHLEVLKRYRTKKRNEYLDLKKAVHELQGRLEQLQQAKELREALRPPSKWQRLAIQLCHEKNAARIENAKLKDLVKAHVAAAKTLSDMLEKFATKIHVNDQPSSTTKCQQFVLVAEPNLRVVSIHAMLDRERDKLDSAFLEAGLAEVSYEFQRQTSTMLHNGAQEVHITAFKYLGLPLHWTTVALWDVILGTVNCNVSLRREAYRVEVIDDDTSYAVGKIDYPFGSFQRRILCKRYNNSTYDTKRCSIVARTIDHDECDPSKPQPYAIEVVWVQLEATADGGTSLKVYHKFRTSVPTASVLRSDVIDQDTKAMQIAIHQYVVEYGKLMVEAEAFVTDLLDLSAFDYSLQWSTEESEALEALTAATSPPSPDERTDKTESPAPPSREHSKNYLTLKRYRTKKRQEVTELRRAVQDLEARLQRLQHAKALNDAINPPTRWQTLATRERKLEQKASAENKKLRELVQDHMITAQILANVLEKTREQAQAVTFLQNDEDKWQHFVLVADPVLRLRGMHAMLDREHTLVESAFVEAGLIDASGEIQKHVAKYTQSNILEFHTIVASSAFLPFTSVVESIWSVLLGIVTNVPHLNRYSDELVVIDADTAYALGQLTHPVGNFQRRVLCKRFFTQTPHGPKCSIVCRSIYEDELMPYDANLPYSKEVSWLEIEPVADGSLCMKYFEKFRPSAWTEATQLSSQWIQLYEDSSQRMRDAVRRYIHRDGETAAIFALAMDHDDVLLLEAISMPATTSSDDSSPKSAKDRRKLTMRRHRLKRRSIQYELREQVQALQLQLHALEERRAIQHILCPPGPWYQRSIEEKKRCREVQIENDRLKQLVRDHLVITKGMSNFFQHPCIEASRPALSHWRSRTLEKDPVQRVTGMHKMLDAAYDDLTGTLVEANLIDTVTDTHHYAVKAIGAMGVELHTIVRHDTPHPFAEAVAGGWSLHRGALISENLDHLCRCVVDIDENTTYTSGTFGLPVIGQIQRRVLCKRYCPNATTCVIVGVGIEEDEACPFEPSCPVMAETSFLVFEAQPQGGTLVKFVQKQRLLLDGSTISGDWVAALKAHTDAFQAAVHAYLEKFHAPQLHTEVDPCAAFLASMLDLSTLNYSTQWSAEESEILDMLVAGGESPQRAAHDDRRTILQRHRLKKREEREELKRAAVELEAKLLELQTAKAAHDAATPVTKWKQLASDEARRETQAKTENKQLKELVRAHMVTAQALSNLLEKTRERTSAMSSLDDPREKWRHCILVQDPALRVAAIHAILDREHEKLSSVFIEAGLVDVEGELQQHIAKYGHNNGMEFHTITHRRAVQPLSAVLKGSIDILRGTVPIKQLNRRCKELVDVDADTTYVIGTFDHPLGEFQRRILSKVYFDPTDTQRSQRAVIVSRSITEDELLPYDPLTPYSVEVSWLLLEALPDGGTSIKYFQKFRPSAWTSKTPISSHCLNKFDEHSMMMRRAARQWIDEAFVLDMLDPSSFEYSLQWSSEERDMLDSLMGEDKTPSVEDDDAASVADSAASSTAPEKRQALAMQRHRRKKRAEHNELKRAAFELEAKLRELQQSRTVQDILQPPTKWQTLATNEAKLEQKAKLENKRLKELVQEHMVTAQAFANLLEKSWHHSKVKALVENAADKWKQLVLVADPSLRVTAMNNILEREYAKMDSAYVEAGLIDAPLDLRKHVSRYTHNNSLEFHTIVCRHTPLPLHAVIDGSWHVLRGTASIKGFNRYCKGLTDIDADTIYVDGWFVHPLGHFQRRTLMKKFREGDTRCVIVCRSIDEDEIAPYDPQAPFVNEVSWNLLEAAPGGGTNVKFFQKFRPSEWTVATPLNSEWEATFDQHSAMISTYVRKYIDDFATAAVSQEEDRQGMDANASEAFVLDMLDFSTLEYSLQWSEEEATLLDSLARSPPAEAPDAKSKQSQALKRHRQKKREEHEELKRAARELEEKLALLQQTKELKNILQPPSKWQALATNEARLRHEATVENKQLKERVHEHMATAQAFANLLEKTWKHSKAVSSHAATEAKWQQLVLVGDPVLRRAGIHAMLDREHDRLNSAFIEAGLIDATTEIQKHVSKYTHTGTLEFHTILYRHTPLPLPAVLEGSWNVLRGTVSIQNLSRFCKELTDVDLDTTYVSGWLDHPLGQFQRRVLCKQYVAPGKRRDEHCVIICRSIEEDELAPYEPSTPHSSEVSWLLLEANEATGGTDVRYFQKFRPSAWTAATPMSAHWANEFEKHSLKVRHAVHQYIDHYGASRRQLQNQ
ncbi:hypothetical protein ACHHYP_02644 [Achlya hypogyna]|uniref:START domain-containing protein n=1 Tax=Achlya hypogyna TaxID=1202772 RepID=A0A1V9Z5X4_ACHHY|nr:hypothetical protein ACHHYP_02644 [Achlya hypogyna]